MKVPYFAAAITTPFLALFWASFGIFGFHCLTALLLPYLWVSDLLGVSFAILTLSFGIAAASFPKLRQSRIGRWLESSRLLLVMGVSILVVLALSVLVKELVPAGVVPPKGHAIVQSKSQWAALLSFGLLFSPPFFFYGLYLSSVLYRAPREHFKIVVTAEFLGAAAGILSFLLLLENATYQTSLVSIPAAIAISLLLSAKEKKGLSKKPAFLGSALLIAAPLLFPTALEPKADLSLMKRETKNRFELSERNHAWNSSTRITRVDRYDRDSNETSALLVLGNGEGYALLPRPSNYRSLRNTFDNRLSSYATLSPTPDSVLVLLAGAGRDMLEVDAFTEGKPRIVGVEFNRRLIGLAKAENPEGLRSFLENPRTPLLVGEARRYIESTNERFDRILVSWAGVPKYYLAGMASRSPQYLFTLEGYKRLLSRLTPNGYLVFSATNKIASLLLFKELLGGDISDKVVLIDDRKDHGKKRLEIVDGHILLVKPSGFTRKERAELKDLEKRMAPPLEVSPPAKNDPFELHREVMAARNLKAAYAKVRSYYRRHFARITDDRPFIFYPIAPSRADWAWLGTMTILVLAGFIFCGLWPGKPPSPTVTAARRNLFFFYFGFSHMLYQMVLVHRLIFVVGSPSLATALGVTCFLVWFGVGSLWSSQIQDPLSFRKAARNASLVAFGFGLLLVLGTRPLMSLTLVQTSLIVILLTVPVGLTAGRLFPAALRLFVSHPEQRSGALGWDALGSAFGILLCPFLLRMVGFQATMGVVVACYLGLSLFPALQNLAQRKQSRLGFSKFRRAA